MLYDGKTRIKCALPLFFILLFFPELLVFIIPNVRGSTHMAEDIQWKIRGIGHLWHRENFIDGSYEESTSPYGPR